MDKVISVCKNNKEMIACVVFGLIVLGMILAAALGMQYAVVPVCFLMVIEALIADLLHRAELWIHGVLVLAEVLAGIILGKVTLVLLCVVVYISATIVLQITTGRSEESRESTESGDSVKAEA